MAKNALTPQQDLLTREFYVNVAEKAEDFLPNAPAYSRQLRAICLLLLNYDRLPGGAFIEKGQMLKIDFGSNDFSDYPCEWADDVATALEAIGEVTGNEITNDTDTSEASTSESSEDSEVREAVLPQDVS